MKGCRAQPPRGRRRSPNRTVPGEIDRLQVQRLRGSPSPVLDPQHHRWAIRVLDLDPALRSPGAVKSRRFETIPSSPSLQSTETDATRLDGVGRQGSTRHNMADQCHEGGRCCK
jgi:hypothetical protein